MPLKPNIPKEKEFLKNCTRCGGTWSTEHFTKTHSKFYEDGFLPICNKCITRLIKEKNWDWRQVDKICQWADIPFIPKEWERIREINFEDAVWGVYSRIFAEEEYEDFGWDSYYQQFKKLREAGVVEDEIPEVREKKFVDLRRKWGANYDEEDLLYLEDLYHGLTISQNVNGALQIDQAKKICKLSLEIDSRIRSGDKDVDKFMSSYDKLVKSAEFTPKNAKNAADFDSIAELALWLEKRGFVNKYYDGTTRDIIDETLKNIQNYNQRLYINEGGIGEEINQRIQSLKNVQEMENYYDTQKEYDLDEYDNAGFEGDDDDFDAGGAV